MRATGDTRAAAYAAAEYVVTPPQGAPLVVRANGLNPALDTLMRSRGAAEVVFLTAWNPGSRPATPAANAAAHARLMEILEEEDLETLPQESRAPDGSWREDGLLVFDLPAADALHLAEMLGQAAILWQALEQPAHLLWTRVGVAEEGA